VDSAIAPVQKAEIQLLKELEHGGKGIVTRTRSDEEGNFQVKTTERARLVVQVSAPGFETKLAPVRAEVVRGDIDLGIVLLVVSCSGPGANCDDVAPRNPSRSNKH
jgi:hypothetical protein